MNKWDGPRQCNTQERRRSTVSEQYSEKCDAAREECLEPQQKYVKEELSRDAMMKGPLRLVDESGILRPEEVLGAVSSDGDKTGHCCSK